MSRVALATGMPFLLYVYECARTWNRWDSGELLSREISATLASQKKYMPGGVGAGNAASASGTELVQNSSDAFPLSTVRGIILLAAGLQLGSAFGGNVSGSG